jgi:hypothetical protein
MILRLDPHRSGCTAEASGDTLCLGRWLPFQIPVGIMGDAIPVLVVSVVPSARNIPVVSAERNGLDPQ